MLSIWLMSFIEIDYLLCKRNASSHTLQKHPSRGVLKEKVFMQRIYRRTPMSKCHFNKVACNIMEITLRHGCSPINLLHIFRKLFDKNTSGGLLLTLPSGSY